MYLGYEFKDPTLEVIEKLNPESIGLWLAFFKYKGELEAPKKPGTKPGKPTKTKPRGTEP